MRSILITGGAGFIGINTAAYFLEKGDRVTIFDNLSRNGTKENLMWLKKSYPRVNTLIHDIRDRNAVEKAVVGQDIVFHFAAQVAVTGSVINPREDYDINAGGSINLLEAVRVKNPKAIVIYSSTNKVYGSLETVKIIEKNTRYEMPDFPNGIAETQPLDFHSPYGCSKGAADQYMHDYARIYGLKTIVFRQSCIYGPHQFGIEDQGWVAWLMIAALSGKPITIYGNGKQVRDLLHIDDLVHCYDLGIKNIKKTAGQVYNIGGGPERMISIWKEFGPTLEKLIGKKISVTYKPTRPGDQPIFVADIRKAKRDFSWEPMIGNKQGIELLFTWLQENI